ncbi:MAG: phenylalanine--tRNA ligase subunit alpha, partial [Gammaproteobacteria bacterium]|nr:phenylalanine--tRNA ligase subunit alpha [Gammaproteobacteria bacterium]MBU2236395.1 phenylalanine--tRNA ligase subunit alpha [Gammaproteobacteria bacterium]
MENLKQILADALSAVAASESESALDDVRVHYLG